MRDFTYDLFVRDMARYKGTPIKGVHLSDRCNEKHHFIAWIKDMARDFKIEWEREHGIKFYDNYEWQGDAFARLLKENNFSDYYKDIYGQRPHLDIWYYVTLLEMPQQSDISYTFCANPIEDAIGYAKKNRGQ